MLVWLAGNMGTIVVSLILIAVVSGIIYGIIKDKKQGRSSCGGNCAHCKMCTACHSARNGDAKCKNTAM